MRARLICLDIGVNLAPRRYRPCCSPDCTVVSAAGAKIAATRTVEGYIAQVVALIDGFAAIRRCWGRDYRHT